MSLQPRDPYSVAKGYVQSAFLIMANPLRIQRMVDDTPVFMAFHMLCGFAVELYLKAFLVHKGYSEGQLRTRETGHNLAELRRLCLGEGLREAGSETLTGFLSDNHKNFTFRYMKPDLVYETIDLRTIFSALSALDVAVDKAIGASASKGLRPIEGWGFPTDAPWRLPKLP